MPSQVCVDAGSRLPLPEAWWLREVWLPGVEEQQQPSPEGPARQQAGGLAPVPEDAPVEGSPEPEEPSEHRRGAAAVGAALLLLLGLEATHSTVASSMSTRGRFMGVEVRRQPQDRYSRSVTLRWDPCFKRPHGPICMLWQRWQWRCWRGPQPKRLAINKLHSMQLSSSAQ